MTMADATRVMAHLLQGPAWFAPLEATLYAYTQAIRDLARRSCLHAPKQQDTPVFTEGVEAARRAGC